jgi:hypothetical protein
MPRGDQGGQDKGAGVLGAWQEGAGLVQNYCVRLYHII